METILLVDDEPGVLAGQQQLLELNGYEQIRQAQSLDAARTILAAEPVALVLLDLTLGHGSGLTLLSEITERYRDTAVVVVTGASDVATAVRCMRAGAYDFLVKGADTNRLPSTVRNALQHRRVLSENALLREAFTRTAPRHPEAFSRFITHDETVLRALVYLEAVATLPDPLLIQGETGVGKELVAEGIHRASGRSGEFVAVNLGGLDDHVFSDTLFGHRKGAFTGADERRQGLVARAYDGTLFLDEIGEMPMESQSRLLRLLDSGEYLPLGMDRPAFSRARVVCATNRDLASAVAEGRFRRDLYYRISVHHVTIPPLRERPGDVAAIARSIMQREAHRLEREPLPLTMRDQQELARQPWHGNVRELTQIILRALLTGGWSWSTKAAAHEERMIDTAGAPAGEDPRAVHFGRELPTPAHLVEQLLQEADRRHPESRTAAAAAIGLSPQAFSNRWKRLRE